MRSYNPPQAVKEYNRLCYNFKRWYNTSYKANYYLYNCNLYDLQNDFNWWLSENEEIYNLDEYLKGIDNNRFNHYKRVAKYNNNITVGL